MKTPAQKLRYSQVDITDGFDDDRRLGPDEWIATTPLNAIDPGAAGLPQVGADADAVHGAAAELSALREAVALPGDGVYCPVCHLANVDLGRLRTPCPRCRRPLLKFGWT